MQSLDPGGFFQQPAPLGRLCADQGADPTLVDHSGRMGAGCHVCKQQLDIACADTLAIDLVVGAGTAFDPPDDFDFGGIVEWRRRVPVGIIENQRHFCDVAGRAVVPAQRCPGGCTGEDHVVHLSATHLLGGGLAHDPFQRFDDIRFTAAVRPDDSRNAVLYLDFNRIEEGFETNEA